MLHRNITVKTYETDADWLCPAGVREVQILPFEHNVNRSSHGAVSAFCDVNGQVRSWGGNANGQLGDASVVPKSSPVVVVGALVGRQVETNTVNLALLATDGQVYAAGNNQHGQLGDASIVVKSSPVLVIGNLRFKKIAIGGNSSSTHFLGITIDHDLYGWGQNNTGQIGDGTILSKSSPVLVLGGHKWKDVAAGSSCSFAVREDGVGFAWGSTFNAELGTGDNLPRTTPKQLSGSLVLKNIYPQQAITEDGDLYGWGQNSYGQIGDGTIFPKSSPVLVVGGKKWRHAGTMTFLIGQDRYGIDTENNLYAWGLSVSGELGNNEPNSTAYSSPTLVLGAKKWWQVNPRPSAGPVGGITLDGTVMSWGAGTNGALGDGTIVAKSSPVVVLGTQRVYNMELYKDLITLQTTPGQTYEIKIRGFTSTFGGYPVGALLRGIELRYIG